MPMGEKLSIQTNMKKFEYIKVGREGLLQRWNQESISANKLNDLGQKGWELVTFTFVGGKLAFGYFKKESKSPNPQMK